ncbi:MAG: STAS domain-containing protein [Ruminiclostridium sp.]|nr:STAS domain-containing protein [Ruminiclostridium sp.]
MSVKISNSGDKLIIFLSGEIDHHSAAEMRYFIDGELERSMPSVVVFDFSEVDFMDSSGIGLVMGRLRVISGWGGKAVIENPRPNIRKMLKLAGLEKLTGQEQKK